MFENKNYSNNPYNLISIEEKKNNEIKKENRYQNLFEKDDNHHQNKLSAKKIKPIHPQSAFHYQNNNNIKSKNINKDRPVTSIQSKKIKRINQDNKNKLNSNNLYDKYKNKKNKEQKSDLKGFKYIPQKRQNQKIIYNKVNYNDYCQKNNIDRNKNYQYYKDKGYYNYRNAMKQYGNQIRNKISSNNKNKMEHKFNNFIKNDDKRGRLPGYPVCRRPCANRRLHRRPGRYSLHRDRKHNPEARGSHAVCGCGCPRQYFHLPDRMGRRQ